MNDGILQVEFIVGVFGVDRYGNLALYFKRL